jgi:hypothetical protein
MARMTATKLAAAGLIAISACVAQSLPDLRIEAVPNGSVLFVKNGADQPLTAFLIELVDYPGSSYALWQDITTTPVAPRQELRIPISNMTVGAVPDYVKVRAAVYADGSSAGIPEKVTQILDRRRALLATIRELIQRLDKASGKEAAIADLEQWTASMPPNRNRNSQAAVNQAAMRGLIGETVGKLRSQPVADTVAGLRTSEKALAASKPAL